MKATIIGNSGWGKSILFQVLLNDFNYHQEHDGAKIATIQILDERMNWLLSVFKPQKYKYPEITIIDAGHGLNLSSPHILESDLLLICVRFFSKDKIRISELEKIFLDLIKRDEAIVEKRLETLESEIKKKHEEELLREKEFLIKINQILKDGKFLNKEKFSPLELKLLLGFQLLTLKKMLVVLNYDQDFENELYNEITDYLKEKGIKFARIASELELELKSLSKEERDTYRKEFNIEEGERENLLKKILEAMDLITFYTTAGKEVRAWLIEKNTSVLQAAGKIHSDMERGFIKAEVISFEDFKNCEGLLPKAKEKGLLRLEGKDYLVKDGDVVYIRFKV
jgi:hypothetical protein